jgi:hypothetical protein
MLRNALKRLLGKIVRRPLPGKPLRRLPLLELLEDRCLPSTWLGYSSNWLDSRNWEGGIPGGPEATAVFGTAIGGHSPELNVPPTIGLIRFTKNSNVTLKLTGGLVVTTSFEMHGGEVTGGGKLTIGSGATGEWDGGTIAGLQVIVQTKGQRALQLGQKGTNPIPTLANGKLLISGGARVQWLQGDIVLKSNGVIENSGTFSVPATGNVHMRVQPDATGSVAGDQFINRGQFVAPKTASSRLITIDAFFTRAPARGTAPAFEVEANASVLLTGGGMFADLPVTIDQGATLTLSTLPALTIGSVSVPLPIPKNSKYTLDSVTFTRSEGAKLGGTLNLDGSFTTTGQNVFTSGMQVNFDFGQISNSGTLEFGAGGGAAKFNWRSGTIQGGQMEFPNLSTANFGNLIDFSKLSTANFGGLLPSAPWQNPLSRPFLGLANATIIFRSGAIVAFNSEHLQLSSGAKLDNWSKAVTINNGVLIDTPNLGPPSLSSLQNEDTGTITKDGSGNSVIAVPFHNLGMTIVKLGVLKVPKDQLLPGSNPIQEPDKTKGHLDVDGFLDMEGGLLSNSGTGEVVGDVRNMQGTVAPGGQGTTGILNLDGLHGDYTQGQNGTLAIDIGGTTPGTGYDQLNLIATTNQPAPLNYGQANLAGTLSLKLINGYTPSVGSSFQVLTYGSRIGDFQTITGDRFGSSNQYYFVPTYNSNNLTLTVANWTGGSAPSISSLSTSSGTTAGGTSVTITGTNFSQGYDVSFGNVPAQSFTVNSSTSITAVAPAQAASNVNVSVTTPLGTGTYSSFTYSNAPAPIVSGLSNTSGSALGGNTLAIVGSGFTGATGVSFGSAPLDPNAFTVLGDNSILATVPAGTPGTVDVTVTTYSGTSATGSGDRYTYNTPPVPVLTSLSPTSGGSGGNGLVSINGTGFTAASQVLFGGIPAPNFTVNSDSLITTLAPPLPAGTWDVSVTTPGGITATSSGDRFTVTANSAPAVTGLSTSTGSTSGGTMVVVSGSGFTGESAVNFGAIAATSVTFVSDTQLDVVAPPQAAGTVDVTVTTPTGTSPAVSADRFTYTAASAPAITAVSPSTGGSVGGTNVSITGSGFTGASAVNFGSVPAASFQVISDGLIFATAPAQAAATVDITVTTLSGTSSTVAADHFVYTASAVPAVTAITPATGSTDGGSTVVLLGSGFTGASAVNFGTTAAAGFTVLSDNAIQATAPPLAAGTVDVTVVTPSGTSSTGSADQFTASAPSLPTVTALSVSSGSTGGGTVLTITGTNFADATAVTVGGINAASFTVNSSTQITAVTPPGPAGAWDVQVSNPAGTSNPATADRFTYNQASTPTVTAVSPSSGSTAGGTTVTLTGSAFTGATAVTFGTTPAVSFTVNSDTSITAVAPAQAAATVDITVTTFAGTSATGTADHFTYNAAAGPVVSGVSPTSGTTAGTTLVRITGSGFTSATAVNFGSVGSSFVVESDTEVLATAPAQAAATVDITVTTPSGTSSTGSADRFTYNAAAAPAVTGVTPSTGVEAGGNTVVVLGSGFTGASAVTFGGNPATAFTVLSDNAISAVVPLGTAGTVDVTVTTPSGTSATGSADHYTYTHQAAPAPAVTGVSPSSGYTGGGRVVTITGSHFTGTTAVKFGTTAATSFTVNSDTQITATAPAGSAGLVDVRVTNPDGTSAVVPGDQFSYTSTPLPTVSSLSATSGTTSGGTAVTINGTNFTNVAGVSFGGVALSMFNVLSSTQISVTSPAQTAGTVDVTVTTTSGTSATASADHFTYTLAPAPTITGLSPSSGTSGSSVNITGTNLGGTVQVYFGGVPATQVVVGSDTQVGAYAPPEAAGILDVTVQTYSGTSALTSADRFTYNAASVPAVTSVSPTSTLTGGGYNVSVSGSGFTAASGVFFGTTPATSFTVNSATSITAVAPPHAAGTVDITVVTPAGTSATSSSDQFTYVAAPAPAVTAVSPNTGTTAGGATVTISGSGFTGASAVTFGTAVASSFTVNSDTSITAVTPPEAAGTVDVTVTTPSGTSATGAADHFTVTAAASPVVSGVTASSGDAAGGSTVTVTGSAFTGATAVTFGTTSATSFTVLSDSALTAIVPAGTVGTVDVTVTTYAGTSATGTADHFTYTTSPVPAITSLSTSTATTAGGTRVVLTGTGFTDAGGVSFGTVAATDFTVLSDTTLVVTAPPQAAVTVDVTVSAYGGTSALVATDRFSFTAASAPAVTAVSPSSGSTAGTTTVTITGTNFTAATGVLFGGVATSFVVNSDTQITALAPPQAAATVDVTIATPSGTSAVVTADHFTYTAAAAPAVTGVSPATGTTAGGVVVGITGSGFTGATGVSFGAVAASSFIVVTDGLVTAVAPAEAAGTVDITVSTPSGTSATVSADHFVYTAAAAPAVTGVTLSTGSTAGGDQVVVTGSGFTGASAVNFNTTAAADFTVLSDTAILVTTPALTAGTVDVKVTTPSGTSATGSADHFTATAPAAPTVTALSVSSGSTAGGTVLTITGTNFTAATGVSFGATPASSFVVNSPTQITVVSPLQAAGLVDVTVTTAGGTSATSTADQFTYTAAAAPTVTAVSAGSSSTDGGAVVLVSGTGFTAATAVNFGSMAASSFTVVSDTLLLATAPAEAAGTVDVTVTTPSGTSATGAADHFSYTAAPAPAVTGISAATGGAGGGTVITIRGTDLGGATAVKFGTVNATSFTVLSNGWIVATVPPGVDVTVDVTVTTFTGTSATSSADQFTYTAAPAPAVSQVAPSSGPTAGGTVVTIVGSGFTGASAVKFGSLLATNWVVISDTVIVATAPAEAAGTVDVTVTTPSGTSATSAADQYTYH